MRLIIVLSVVVVWYGCNIKEEKRKIFELEHITWKAKRYEYLRKEFGYLSITGLYWLKEGANSFGSDSSNDIIFPPQFVGHVGIFFVTGQNVTLVHTKDIVIEDKNKQPLPEVCDVFLDTEDSSTLMRQENIYWKVIARGGKLAIRLWDMKNPLIDSLKSFPAFPIDMHWKIKAKLQKNNYHQKINIQTVFGYSDVHNCPGIFIFEKDGKNYHLTPYMDEDIFFIVFADSTSGVSTYGGGRFLHAEKIKDDEFWLDFNKAYNPPCSFSPYTTCPVPPKENILPLKVEAGEQYFLH